MAVTKSLLAEIKRGARSRSGGNGTQVGDRGVSDSLMEEIRRGRQGSEVDEFGELKRVVDKKIEISDTSGRIDELLSNLDGGKFSPKLAGPEPKRSNIHVPKPVFDESSIFQNPVDVREGLFGEGGVDQSVTEAGRAKIKKGVALLEEGKESAIRGGLRSIQSLGTTVEKIGVMEQDEEFAAFAAAANSDPLVVLNIAPGVKKKVGKVLEDVGAKVRKYFGKKAKAHDTDYVKERGEFAASMLKDPMYWASTLPELVVQMIPAFATGAGTGVGIKILGSRVATNPATVRKLALLGSTLTASYVGANQEASSTYETGLEKGMSKEEAVAASDMMLLASGALNAISFGFMFKGAAGVKKKVIKYLTTSFTEPITEWAEEPAEAVILGEDIKQAMWDGRAVLAPSAVMGFLFGAIGGGGVPSRRGKKSVAKNKELLEQVPQEDKKAIQDVVERMEGRTGHKQKDALGVLGIKKTKERTPTLPIIEGYLNKKIKVREQELGKIWESQKTDETKEAFVAKAIETERTDTAIQGNFTMQAEVDNTMVALQSYVKDNNGFDTDKLKSKFLDVKSDMTRREKAAFLRVMDEQNRGVIDQALSPKAAQFMRSWIESNIKPPATKKEVDKHKQETDRIMAELGKKNEKAKAKEQELERLLKPEKEAALKGKPMKDLKPIAKELGVVGIHKMRKSTLVDAITKAQSKEKTGLASEIGAIDIGREPDLFDNEQTKAMDKMRDEGKAARKTHIKDVFVMMERLFIDSSGAAKRALMKKFGATGEKVVQELELALGSSAEAARIYKEEAKNVYGGVMAMSSSMYRAFDQYRWAHRNIEILEQHPERATKEGFGLADAKQTLEDFKGLPKEKQDALVKMDKAYTAAINRTLSRMEKAGLLKPERKGTGKDKGKILAAEKDVLKSSSEHFLPRRILELIDPIATRTSRGGSTISVRASGIMGLTENSHLQDIEIDSRHLLQQYILRAERRIADNVANTALYELAKSNDNNGLVNIRKKGDRLGLGETTIAVKVDGVTQEMVVDNEFALSWIRRDPILSTRMAEVAGWVSGSKILRFMATGGNPEFALTNFFRDIAHMWLITDAYSSVVPYAGLQIANDIRKVGWDAIRRKGRYVDMLKQNGGLSFMTHQGRVSESPVGGFWGSVQDYLGYVGETSEIVSRLALRERKMDQLTKQGMPREQAEREATWRARQYLDFSQGGTLAKAIDSGVPYFNAAIQGTRGLFRGYKQNPAKFSVKLAQVGVLAMGIALMNMTGDPDGWDDISDRDKVNNFIFLLPGTRKNSKGEDVRTYIRVPKDQGQRFYSAIFEAAAAKLLGKEVNTEQLETSIYEALPVGREASELMPPSLKAWWSYAYNKDFWMNKDIWRGSKQGDPSQEITNFSHPAFVKFGSATGLSPARLESALQTVFTRGNAYTFMSSQVWRGATDDLSPSQRKFLEEDFSVRMKKLPFMRKALRETHPLNSEQKRIKKAQEAENTRRTIMNRELDSITSGIERGKKTRRDLAVFIRKHNKNDRKTLDRRAKRNMSLAKVRSFRSLFTRWSTINQPEVRAQLFYNKYITQDKKMKGQMLIDAGVIKGFESSRFKKEFRRLLRGK